ncbi:hypothetical protein Bca101_003925 [Brassica carinata]
MEARDIPYTMEKSQTSELDGLSDLVLAKVEKDMGPQVPVTIAADQAGKEEVDARSVFVGNSQGPLQHTQSMSGLKDITESSNSRESFSSGTHPGR